MVDSLARALLLEDAELEHLRSLAARAARSAPEPPAAPSRTVRPGVKLLLESLRPHPAHVVSRTNDLLAANPGGLRLLPGIEDWPARERNIARYLFLHPTSRDLFHDWNTQIRGCAPWPAPTPTPPTSPTSPVNSSSRAPSSPACGSAMTSRATPTAAKPSTTPTSATSPSATSPWNWKAPPATAW